MEEKKEEERPGEEQFLPKSIPVFGDKVLTFDAVLCFLQSCRHSCDHCVNFIYLRLLEISLFFNGNIEIVSGWLTAS